jgi:O-antigen/teichoic acid export membrane protein
MFGNTASQGFSAIALILISRLLGPSKFGEFSLGFAIALILNRFSDIGLSTAIQRFVPKAEGHDQVNKIVGYASRLKLVVVTIEVIVGLLIYQPLAAFLNFDNELIILMAFLLSPATVIFEHFQAILQSLHRFWQSVMMNVIQAVAKAGLALAFWVGQTQASVPILATYLAAPLLSVLAMRWLLPAWVKIKPFTGDFSTEKKLTKSVMGHAAIGFMAAGVIENIDILFVQRFLNTYEAGLYGGVSRVALIIGLMAFSLSTVLNPRVAAFTSRKQIRNFLNKSLILGGLCVLGFLVYLLVAEWVLILTVGREYIAGLQVMNILMASSFLTLAVIPLMALFFSFDAPWYFSVSGILQFVIIVGGNLMFVPTLGLEASAWTRLVSRLVLFLFTAVLVWYFYQHKKPIEGQSVRQN